jgi:hypothetical protein
METQTIIAEQQTGAFSNTDHSVECADIEQAKELFKLAAHNLINIGGWGELCGKGSADFKLTDENGQEVFREAKINDHIKIDIPGPGPFAGKGYDWVRVEEIDKNGDQKEETERLIISVRPAPNPETDSDTVAHFFSSMATSNFVVRRDKNKVSAAVLGRNEVPNTSESEGADKIRNSMIAASAIAGIAKLQWTMLVKGVLAQK